MIQGKPAEDGPTHLLLKKAIDAHLGAGSARGRKRSVSAPSHSEKAKAEEDEEAEEDDEEAEEDGEGAEEDDDEEGAEDDDEEAAEDGDDEIDLVDSDDYSDELMCVLEGSYLNDLTHAKILKRDVGEENEYAVCKTCRSKVFIQQVYFSYYFY